MEGTETQRETFFSTLREFSFQGIPFAIGGSSALAAYLGRPAAMRDLDLYVSPGSAADAVRVLNKLGFSDYYDQSPYQRHWIYRGIRGDAIVDVIWAMANHRADVDDEWIAGGDVA